MTRRLFLSVAQEHELLQVRDHAPKPYLRERAAALLRIAGGQSATAVARRAGLRPRRPETVGAWLTRYLAEGVPGLSLRAGRGRKPAFFPCVPDGAAGAGRAAARGAPCPQPVGAGADPLDTLQPAGCL